jgi:hypothetical protein
MLKKIGVLTLVQYAKNDLSPQRPKPKIIIQLTQGSICNATIAKLCQIDKLKEIFYYILEASEIFFSKKLEAFMIRYNVMIR